MFKQRLASNISECPMIEELWNLDGIESKILISHSDVGPYIHIICPPGHHVVGPTMLTCLKGGVWDDVTLPTCSASSMFDVPESTMILISIMAGCGALIIVTFTFILAHLLYFKSCPLFPARSSDQLNRSIESDASMTYHRVNKRYHTVSPPQYPTLNGKPMSSSTNGHMHSEPGNVIATVTNSNMFVNHVFQAEEQLSEHPRGSQRPTVHLTRDDSKSSLQSIQIPEQLHTHENRTEF